MTVKTTPPPPVDKPSPADQFSAFTGRDFRTATIENHWNDPPNKIFKASEEIDVDVDSKIVHKVINETVKRCKAQYKTGMQKRMIDDTDRRMIQLLKKVDDHELNSDVLHQLCQLCQAMEKGDFKEALDMHVKLMTKAYDDHGQWILGLKRLIDLDEKTTK
ncbi:unnamed protein product [Umbelopsis ramanniana]